VFFRRDLAASPIGTARVDLKRVPPGKYDVAVHRVGYRQNDVYADYMSLGSPESLSREQVAWLAAKNAGAPSRIERVVIGSDGSFARDLEMRENDVVCVTLRRV